jgi:hypothetical protein
LLASADRSLYSAKQAGRNTTHPADSRRGAQRVTRS